LNLLNKLRENALELGKRVVIRVTEKPKTVEEAVWSPPATSEEQAIRDKLAELESVLKGLEAQAAFYKRRSEEYFKLFVSIEAQRDEWKMMYMRDGAAHQQAQAILENTIEGARTAIRRCIDVVNLYRERAGEPKVAHVGEIKDPPIGIAAETKERLAAEQAAVPTQIDAKTEQERIDAALGAPSEATKAS
jgi:hypothetical protein